jgi:hypothetical protein
VITQTIRDRLDEEWPSLFAGKRGGIGTGEVHLALGGVVEARARAPAPHIEIADAQRQSVLAVMLADKLEAQRGLRTLEQKRNRKRRDLFEAQDEIEAQRMTLIEGIERQLAATHHYTRLFTLRWTLG